MERFQIICVLTGYFTILFILAIVASRRMKSESDFFIAGKKLGYWVVSISSRATGESAWLLLGLTGLGWAIGMHAFWVVFGEVMGVTVCWIWLAARFKEATDDCAAITIPDYLEARFRDRKHVIRVISAVVLLVMVVFYISAQLVASGKTFNTFLGMDYRLGTLLGLVIILFYTATGGFLAVAWSDLLQGIMMLVTLFVAPVLAIVSAGGIGHILTALSEQDPALLTVFGKNGFGAAGILSAVGLWGIGLAFLGSPQIFVRFMAIKRKEDLVKGSLVAVIFTIFTDVGAVALGMAGRAIFPYLSDQEAVLPTLSSHLFPVPIAALIMASILAAMMSTADSLLILAASACVRDLYHKVFNPTAGERRLLFLSRLLTVLISVIALAFAFGRERLVFWLALFGWAGIATSFCPVIILSLFWKRLTKWGAVAGMLTGFITTVLWKSLPVSLVFKFLPQLGSWVTSRFPEGVAVASDIVYEMIPGFILSFTAIFVVSMLTRPSYEALDE